jgi:hypothetical protein
MPGPGELPPLRVMLCRTRELGDKDTISLRTLIDLPQLIFRRTMQLPGLSEQQVNGRQTRKEVNRARSVFRPRSG